MGNSNHFGICVRNKGYEASLEIRKIYQLVDDDEAKKHHQLRVIDESGDDYLYPEEFFVHIDLPQSVEKKILNAA